jgi:F0F1-type ATP synthase assembly protein I
MTTEMLVLGLITFAIIGFCLGCVYTYSEMYRKRKDLINEIEFLKEESKRILEEYNKQWRIKK